MRHLAAALLLLGALPAATRAQDDAPIGSGQGEMLSVSGKDVGIPGRAYVVFRPRGVREGKLYPLVWTVPDEDETVEDAVRALAPLSTDRRPVFVAGVPSAGPESSEEEAPRYGERCSGFAQDVLAAHPIDPGRVAVHGRGFGAAFVSIWSYQHQRDHHATAPFREIWLSDGGLPQPDDARPTRIRYFVGRKADGADGVGEIVLRARQAFRFASRSVYDVWFSERPESGRGIDEALRKELRAVIQSWPSYAGALPESLATEPIIETARQWAMRGQLDETFALLQAADAGEEPVRKAAVAARKALEQWLRRHAKAEERRIVRLRSICSWYELAAHRDSQPEDAALRKALTTALERIRGSKAMIPEFAAEKWFKDALIDLRTDPRTGRGLLAQLAGREYPDTVYGRRARGLLRAQYDR